MSLLKNKPNALGIYLSYPFLVGKNAGAWPSGLRESQSPDSEIWS
jgi:hypothetical protein